jgi:hypothetical protein
MKTLAKFYPANTETVAAYEQADIDQIRSILLDMLVLAVVGALVLFAWVATP